MPKVSEPTLDKIKLKNAELEEDKNVNMLKRETTKIGDPEVKK